MAEKVIVSPQFVLKARDFVKGAIMAVGTPVLYLLQEMIPSYDLHPLAKAAIAALVTYLLKNFFEKPKVITTYASNEQANVVANNIADDNQTTVK